MAGLYIHIPFCKQACHYCDFHFSTGQEHRTELVKGIVRELALQKEYLAGENLTSIYFGGGTPSLLTGSELESILKAVRLHFAISDPEITLEANPDDLTGEKLIELKQMGINRLSIGMQSFDNDILKFLNRAHNAADALHCFDDARRAGFENISIDLIYAIPGQDQAKWEANVMAALLLKPNHLSSYSLTIEEKTAFGKWQRSGTLHPVDDESSARQFEYLMEATQNAGYEHYEISNFCKPGFYSRHNSSYWKQLPYLGVGPSAHSYDRVSRQFNVSNNALYSKAIEQGRVPFEREILTSANKINEYVFTTLRTGWGCDMKKIKSEFEFDFWQKNEGYLNDLVQKKLVTIQRGVLTLTGAGKLFADKIASDLFVDEREDS